MAHQNINERRKCVRDLINQGVDVTTGLRRSLAKKFGCSISAIHNDIIAIATNERPGGYTTKRMRALIHQRDGAECQYCGRGDGVYLIVEHVIPRALGGLARTFNLVLSCESCNIRKGRSVWIPKNFSVLASDNPEWARQIEALSRGGQDLSVVSRSIGCQPRKIESKEPKFANLLLPLETIAAIRHIANKKGISPAELVARWAERNMD